MMYDSSERLSSDERLAREQMQQAFDDLRSQARETGLSDLSLEEINKEIQESRKGE